MSKRLVKCGSANPSYTGHICVTPSPESMTTPVSKPKEENKTKYQVLITLFLSFENFSPKVTLFCTMLTRYY